MIMTDHIRLTLPAWVTRFLENKQHQTFKALEDQMSLAIELSALNVKHATGGPFGAAIFESNTGRLVSVGVNRVVPENCSMAHAETMAIMMAQQHLSTFDLGGSSRPIHRLVSSAQMCVMCYGALFWSGLREVFYAATAHDVEALVGFDEGPVHPNWIEEASKRGICIEQGPWRDEACTILKQYKNSGQIVYNSRGS